MLKGINTMFRSWSIMYLFHMMVATEPRDGEREEACNKRKTSKEGKLNLRRYVPITLWVSHKYLDMVHSA